MKKKFDDREVYHSSFGGHRGGHHGSRMRTDDYGNNHHQVFGYGSHHDIDCRNEYHHGRRPNNGSHYDDKE